MYKHLVNSPEDLEIARALRDGYGRYVTELIVRESRNQEGFLANMLNATAEGEPFPNDPGFVKTAMQAYTTLPSKARVQILRELKVKILRELIEEEQLREKQKKR